MPTRSMISRTRRDGKTHMSDRLTKMPTAQAVSTNGTESAASVA
jgi:hypothetical protein